MQQKYCIACHRNALSHFVLHDQSRFKRDSPLCQPIIRTFFWALLGFSPSNPIIIVYFSKFYVTMYNLHLFVPMICTCMFSFCDVVGTFGGFGLYLGVFLIYCAICTYGWDIHQLYWFCLVGVPFFDATCMTTWTVYANWCCIYIVYNYICVLVILALKNYISFTMHCYIVISANESFLNVCFSIESVLSDINTICRLVLE